MEQSKLSLFPENIASEVYVVCCNPSSFQCWIFKHRRSL